MFRTYNKSDYSLYLVTDSRFCQQYSLENIVELAVRGGVKVVQLREKNASTKEILRTGENLKKILEKYQVPLIINDRVDITLALDAEGVHLGQKDYPYEKAREILGNRKIIGLSVSSLAEANIAENYPIDYLGVGPIFATATKGDAAAPLGIKQLAAIRKKSHHPLVAIGGININNTADVMATGVDGIAVVSAIFEASCPKLASQHLATIIKNSYEKI